MRDALQNLQRENIENNSKKLGFILIVKIKKCGKLEEERKKKEGE